MLRSSGDCLDINQFLEKFGISFEEVVLELGSQSKGQIVRINNEIYYAPDDLVELKNKIQSHANLTPAACGVFLGCSTQKKFTPGVVLLDVLAKKTKQKIVVDKKASWLYICGRDVFGKSIVSGAFSQGTYALVLDHEDSVLGYGVFVSDASSDTEDKVVFQNLFDIGDFLRRER